MRAHDVCIIAIALWVLGGGAQSRHLEGKGQSIIGSRGWSEQVQGINKSKRKGGHSGNPRTRASLISKLAFFVCHIYVQQ
jgi:hypothetical protein